MRLTAWVHFLRGPVARRRLCEVVLSAAPSCTGGCVSRQDGGRRPHADTSGAVARSSSAVEVSSRYLSTSVARRFPRESCLPEHPGEPAAELRVGAAVEQELTELGLHRV